MADTLRFFAVASRDLRNAKARGITTGEYLQACGFSAAFADAFLMPVLAGICTCTYAAVKDLPAVVVLDYSARCLLQFPVKRVRRGTQDVAARLSAGVQHIRLGTAVAEVTPGAACMEVSAGGRVDPFDHVVIATQSNHAMMLLQDSTREREILLCFRYQTSTVLMHSDARLAPPDRARWRPVNIILATGTEMPMATIWMNAVHAGLGGSDIFQTWNPLIEPDPGRVLSRVSVQRPLVNASSVRGLAQLEALHAMPVRRVWFAGAYAASGV